MYAGKSYVLDIDIPPTLWNLRDRTDCPPGAEPWYFGDGPWARILYALRHYYRGDA